MMANAVTLVVLLCFMNGSTSLRPPVREYAGLITNQQAVLIDPHEAAMKLFNPNSVTNRKDPKDDNKTTSQNTTPPVMPTPAALIDQPEKLRPRIQHRISANATESHERLIQQLQNRMPFWRKRVGNLRLGNTYLHSQISRLGGGGSSLPKRRRRPSTSHRRTPSGFLSSDITKENVIKFLRNNRNLTTTTTMQPTIDFLSRWHNSYSRGKPDEVKDRVQEETIPINERIRNSISEVHHTTTHTPESVADEKLSTNVKSKTKDTGITSVHDMTSTHFANSSSTFENKRQSTRISSRNKLGSKLMVSTTTSSPSKTKNLLSSPNLAKKPHESALHDTQILESIKTIVKSASGETSQATFLKNFNSNTSPKPLDIFAGVEPLYGFKPTYTKSSSKNHSYVPPSQQEHISTKLRGHDRNSNSKRPLYSNIEPNAANAGPTVIVSPPPLGHNLALKVGHSLPVLTKKPINQDGQELRTLETGSDIVIGRPAALIQAPSVTAPSTTMPPTLRNSEGSPAIFNTNHYQNLHNSHIESSSLWPPRDLGPLLDAIKNKYHPFNEHSSFNSPANLKEMADSGEISDFFKSEQLKAYIKKDQSRFQPLSPVDRLGAADTLETTEADSSITGQFVALSGLALLMAFGGYVMFSSSEPIGESRGNPDPLLIAVNQAKNGLKLLQQGLDEYETKLIKNKQNVDISSSMYETFSDRQPVQDISLDLDKIWKKIKEVPEKIADKLFYSDKSLLSKSMIIIKKQLRDPNSLIGSVKNSLMASLTLTHPPSRYQHILNGDDSDFFENKLWDMATNIPVKGLLESSLLKTFVYDIISQLGSSPKTDDDSFENRAFRTHSNFISDLYSWLSNLPSNNGSNIVSPNPKLYNQTDEEFMQETIVNTLDNTKEQEAIDDSLSNIIRNETKQEIQNNIDEQMQESEISISESIPPEETEEKLKDLNKTIATKPKSIKFDTKDTLVLLMKSLFGNDSITINDRKPNKELKEKKEKLKVLKEEAVATDITKDEIDTENIALERQNNGATKNISNLNFNDDLNKGKCENSTLKFMSNVQNNNITVNDDPNIRNSEHLSMKLMSYMQNNTAITSEMSHKENTSLSEDELLQILYNEKSSKFKFSKEHKEKTSLENKLKIESNNRTSMEEKASSSQATTKLSNGVRQKISGFPLKDDSNIEIPKNLTSKSESSIKKNITESSPIPHKKNYTVSVTGISDTNNYDAAPKQGTSKEDNDNSSSKETCSDCERKEIIKSENKVDDVTGMRRNETKHEDDMTEQNNDTIPLNKESNVTAVDYSGVEYSAKESSTNSEKVDNNENEKSNTTKATKQESSEKSYEVNTYEESELMPNKLQENGEPKNPVIETNEQNTNVNTSQNNKALNNGRTNSTIPKENASIRDNVNESHEKKSIAKHKTDTLKSEHTVIDEAINMHSHYKGQSNKRFTEKSNTTKEIIELTHDKPIHWNNKTQANNTTWLQEETPKPYNNESSSKNIKIKQDSIPEANDDSKNSTFLQFNSEADETRMNIKDSKTNGGNADKINKSKDKEHAPVDRPNRQDVNPGLEKDLKETIYNKDTANETANDSISSDSVRKNKDTIHTHTQSPSEENVPNSEENKPKATTKKVKTTQDESTPNPSNKSSHEYNVFLQNKEKSLLQEMVSRYFPHEALPDNLITI